LTSWVTGSAPGSPPIGNGVMPSPAMTGLSSICGFHLTRQTPRPGRSMSFTANLMLSWLCSSSTTI